LGSPGSFVALTLVPMTLGEPPGSTTALVKLSLAGGAGGRPMEIGMLVVLFA